jgi:hypothetical protein
VRRADRNEPISEEVTEDEDVMWLEVVVSKDG